MAQLLQFRLLAVVLLLALFAYLMYIWSKRRDQIACPACGGSVDLYADECPYCGHKKGDTPPGTDQTSEPDDDADAVDYEELAQDTIASIKDRFEEEQIDLDRLLEVEKQNKNRKTLIAWIEEQRDI